MLVGRTLLVVAVIASVASQPTVTPPKGFTALYNGRDLTGWRGGDTYDHRRWLALPDADRAKLDAEWTAKNGSKWNIERLVRIETAQNLADSACGGTHRLYALTKARNRFLEEGGKLGDNPDGTWEQAAAGGRWRN